MLEASSAAELQERVHAVAAPAPSRCRHCGNIELQREFTSQAVESVVPDMQIGGKAPATTNFEGFTFVDKGHLGR